MDIGALDWRRFSPSYEGLDGYYGVEVVPEANASRSLAHVTSRVSGRTRVSAMTVMKLVSPLQRGRDASAGLFVGAGDVVVAPGGPETVHKSEYKVKDRRIPGLSWSQNGGTVIKIVRQGTCRSFLGLCGICS